MHAEPDSLPSPPAMSSARILEALKQVCTVKGIQVEEPSFLSELPGLSVVRGATIVIYLCPAQPAEAKLWTVARELAHLALGHIPSVFSPSQVREPAHAKTRAVNARQRRSHPAPHIPNAAQRERQADAWAVHALAAIGGEDWATTGDVGGRASWTPQGDAAIPFREGIWESGDHATLPDIALAAWVRYRDWSFVPSPRDWLLQSAPPHLDEAVTPEQCAWDQAFRRSYRLLIAARDYWRDLGRLSDEPEIAAAWDEHGDGAGDGDAPLALLRCARADLPSGALDTASHEAWEVVLWLCKRRWSTTLVAHDDDDSYAVVTAAWDPMSWPAESSAPPRIGRTYEDWITANRARAPLFPIFTSLPDDAAPDIARLVEVSSENKLVGAEPPDATPPAVERLSSQERPVRSEPTADAPARPQDAWDEFPAVTKHSAPPANYPIFFSSLALPDAPAWRSEPSYSPQAARALAQAYRYLRLGDGDIKAPLYASRSIASVLRLRMSPSQHLRILYVLAWVAKSLGDFPEARLWLESGLERAGNLHDSSATIELLFLRGAIYRATSHLAAAADDYQECRRLLNAIGEDPGISEDSGMARPSLTLDLLARLAGFEFYLSRYESLDQHLDEARRLVPLYPDAELSAASIEWVQALLFRWRRQPERALRHALAAAEVYSRSDSPPSRVRIEYCVAEIALDLAFVLPPGTDQAAFVELALPHLRTATTLAVEASDDAGEGLALLAHARYSRLRGLEEDRIAATERVMRTARRLDDLALLAQAVSALADELASRGDMDIAANCYREVLGLLDGSDLTVLAIPARRALWQAEEMKG